MSGKTLLEHLSTNGRSVASDSMLGRERRIVQKCSCGIEYTLSQFRKLRYVGTNAPGEEDGIEPYYLETRMCVCGSSRGIWLDSERNYFQEECL